MSLPRIRVVLLQQQTVDETTSLPVDVSGYQDICFYLIGYGTTSSGAVTYEESTDDPAIEMGGRERFVKAAPFGRDRVSHRAGMALLRRGTDRDEEGVALAIVPE